MPCFVAQSFAFASGNSCFNNSRVQKHKNSACAEFLGLLCRFFVAQSFGFAAFKKAGKFYFGGTGVGVADKPRNVLCIFYVVLTGVWGWLGRQGEPRLLSILSFFSYAPPPIIFCFFILFDVSNL